MVSNYHANLQFNIFVNAGKSRFRSMHRCDSNILINFIVFCIPISWPIRWWWMFALPTIWWWHWWNCFCLAMRVIRWRSKAYGSMMPFIDVRGICVAVHFVGMLRWWWPMLWSHWYWPADDSLCWTIRRLRRCACGRLAHDEFVLMFFCLLLFFVLQILTASFSYYTMLKKVT